MFVLTGCVQEGVLDTVRLHPLYGFPVGMAEVSTKCKANLKEEIFSKDGQKCTFKIRMMFDLVET